MSEPAAGRLARAIQVRAPKTFDVLRSTKRFFSGILDFVVYRLRTSRFPANPVRRTLTVLSAEESLARIAAERLSVARYGDGEIDIIDGRGLGFQPYDAELAEKLREVAAGSRTNMAIAIPDIFRSLAAQNRSAARHWRRHLRFTGSIWFALFDPTRVYFNSFLSRPYIDWRDKSGAVERFDAVKMLWKGRDVILLEGAQSRLGVGNDLLEGAASVRRILCPSVDAWSRRGEILDAARREAARSDVADHGSVLFLLALGPTATILADILSRLGHQAIDIGHIDVEYEWFRRGATHKTAVPGKYVNEADSDGESPGEESEEPAGGPDDPSYSSQVVAVVP